MRILLAILFLLQLKNYSKFLFLFCLLDFSPLYFCDISQVFALSYLRGLIQAKLSGINYSSIKN